MGTAATIALPNATLAPVSVMAASNDKAAAKREMGCIGSVMPLPQVAGKDAQPAAHRGPARGAAMAEMPSMALELAVPAVAEGGPKRYRERQGRAAAGRSRRTASRVGRGAGVLRHRSRAQGRTQADRLQRGSGAAAGARPRAHHRAEGASGAQDRAPLR